MSNSRLHSLLEERNPGNIAAQMKSYAKLETVNDGSHYYGQIDIQAEEPAYPCQATNNMMQRLTDKSFSVTQFTESFLIMELETEVVVPKLTIPEFEDDSLTAALLKHQYLFIGLKSSNEIIHDYQIYHKNLPVNDSQQQNSVYEQFLLSTYKAGTEKDNKKYVHSQYKDISTLDTSSCGVFLSFYDIQKSTTGRMTIKFPVVIPYRDILQLNGFVDYPNDLFGDLKFRFTLERNALVWCQVSPKISISRSMVEGTLSTTLEHLSSVVAIEEASFRYTRQFTQIGLPGSIHVLTGWDATNAIPSACLFLDNFTPSTTSMRVLECHANCAGYQYNETCKADLADFFSKNPFVVNAQKITMQPFNTGPTKNGFAGTTCNLTLNMVTDFILLFPKNAQQLTCFENPMYQNFQLVVANRRFPDKTCSTFGPLFYQLQLDASDFDSLFPCSDEYEDSLTVKRSTETLKLKPYTDTTSFTMIFQCERSGAEEMFFDGMDSHGSIVSAQLFGNPAHPNADVYYEADRQPPPPIVFTEQDTIWSFSSISDGTCQYFTTYQGASMFTASVL